MLSQTAFYVIYGIGVVWFAAAAIYSYQAAIKDFINLAREGKKNKQK
ncbi:hypothetical protein LI177_10270 [bacterium 210820-DFI.6.37]|nr:hypothetical protein [bacterium 210820-DFI.6.37]